jgi:hypothetical protein
MLLAMRHQGMTEKGHAYYAQSVRDGSMDTYAAYRLTEGFYNGERCDPEVRKATMHLLEHDPWFLATSMTRELSSLTTEDLETITPLIGVGPAQEYAAMLRGILWHEARRGPYHPDAIGLVQLQRSLDYFLKVPLQQRESEWHRMVVACYHKLDYQKYKRAFATLFATTDPDWRSSQLHQFL